jgi:hypothetical protein
MKTQQKGVLIYKVILIVQGIAVIFFWEVITTLEEVCMT